MIDLEKRVRALEEWQKLMMDLGYCNDEYDPNWRKKLDAGLIKIPKDAAPTGTRSKKKAVGVP